MHRRHFLKISALTPLLGLNSSLLYAQNSSSSTSTLEPDQTWRNYEITTELHPVTNNGSTQIWMPMPAENMPIMQKITRRSSWQVSAGGNAQLQYLGAYRVPCLSVQWPAHIKDCSVKIVSHVSTCDRQVDLQQPAQPAITLSGSERQLYLKPTKYLPTDGGVKKLAERITWGQGSSDISKARAIYDWVVDNTSRDPATAGCGTGNVAQMIASGLLSGKCADINALFVALCRTAGIPARDIYGIRIDNSKLSYKSLGKYGDISKAQHCRAEFFANGYGWIPADPADVRKVMLEEEPGGLPADNPKVQAIRRLLFGGWEMNWMAYNTGHDLLLSGSNIEVPYLMYPNGRTAQSMLDSIDPVSFRYQISSKRT